MLTNRKKTLEVNVGGVKIGGDNPIVIQSMTDTPTADVAATVLQIKELVEAGSELVRMTINDDKAAEATPLIIQKLKEIGINTPIVGDFHYNGHILLDKYPEMAKSLAKYRVNPGNMGKGSKHDDNYKSIIQCAIKYDKPIRIGINGGSLDQELLEYNMDENSKSITPKSDKEVFLDSILESTLLSIQKAEEFGLPRNRIIISAKLSDVQDVIAINEMISAKTDCPLHLGLTEAGGSAKGITASSAALGILLQQGIGDTIRVSITPEPGQPRSLEVQICKYLLQSMSFRYFQPLITSCPGCGRTSSKRFQILAKQISDEVNKRLPDWQKKYIGFEKKKISVMGCIVNGIGEAKHADIGIFFPGNGENPQIPVYIGGKQYTVLEEENVFENFMEIVEKYLRGGVS